MHIPYSQVVPPQVKRSETDGSLILQNKATVPEERVLDVDSKCVLWPPPSESSYPFSGLVGFIRQAAPGVFSGYAYRPSASLPPREVHFMLVKQTK